MNTEVSGMEVSYKKLFKMPTKCRQVPINGLSAQQKIIFQFVEEKVQITSHQAKLLLKLTEGNVLRIAT